MSFLGSGPLDKAHRIRTVSRFDRVMLPRRGGEPEWPKSLTAKFPLRKTWVQRSVLPLVTH